MKAFKCYACRKPTHLVHSMWIFLLQIFLTFQDIVYVADNRDFFGNDLGLELTWASWRHSTEWLAGVKATRNWDEDYVEFEPGCAIGNGYFLVDGKELPTCNAWYLLLIGQLRLREDPDFTLQILEQCLFTLSGSLFLLIIR